MNLLEAFVPQIEGQPEAAAIIESRGGDARSITFANLDTRARKVAALLRQNGIKAGDHILIFHPVSIELYTVLLGVFRLGAVAMFLDPSAGRAHIEQCCQLQAPRALIASPKAHLLRLSSKAVRQIPVKFVVGLWVPGAESLSAGNRISPLADWENCNPTSAALLTFTSGSTGLPKAAVRTHGFLLAQHRVLEKRIELVPGEVDLTTLPIFLLANLASGVTSVVPDADLRSPGAILAEPVLQQIKRHNITRAAASPALFERLLGDDVADRGAFRGLRKIYTGGAPVFPRLLSKLTEGAPDAQIEAVYGSTEAEPIAHLNARCIQPEDRLAMRRGNGLLAGKPIPEIRLRIIQDQWGTALGSLDAGRFNAMQFPSGQIGEIVVTGDHVLKGYLHGRGNEETKFSVAGEVWHRTGDAGKFDDIGRLWLMGRCAARIDDPRGPLYPFAVECVANDQAGVRRAAFLEHGGARLLAIEPTDMCDKNVEQDLHSDLAWASIDRIIRIKKLPVDKRHNAKIDYPELRRLLKCEV